MTATPLSPDSPTSTHPAPPPLRLTLAEVVAGTGATLLQGEPESLLGAVDIDSRRLHPGDWFLAHVGSQVDGHSYLTDAALQQIGGAIVTDPSRLPAGWSLPTLVVESHQDFLERLGMGIRSRFTGPVAGITGSVGKTSCRHILSHLLSADRTVLSTPWNWNTEIGVPLTLTHLLREGADVCVLELAMRGAGQISQLTRIARPQVGILTAIAPVHLELLGSLWGILEAKLELFREMAPGGTWIYPASDTFLQAGLANLPAIAHQTLRFMPGQELLGPGDPTILRADTLVWQEVGESWSFNLNWQHQRVPTALRTIAQAQIWSALAAIAGALALGMPLEQIGAQLPKVPPITGRMEIRRRFPQRVLLFDCYNSNPVSATEALETLVRVAGSRPAIAILGGMKELGAESERYHRELGTRVRLLGIPWLLAIGEEATWIADAAAGGGTSVFTAATADDAVGWLQTQVPADAVVLLKGSRAYALESLLEHSW